MSEVYKRILELRQDMTEWLIHFTRLQGSLSSLQVLGKILSEGVLRPGFAPRGKPARPTVYGPTSAVCFSEQPIAAMLQYLDARDDADWLSGYGLLVHKHDVYVAGGLPVIYGLRNAAELDSSHPSYDLSERLLDPTNLPFHEQYRYVAFAPDKPIDWTHEREWRWPSDSTFGGDEHLFFLASLVKRVFAFVRNDTDIGELQKIVKNARERGEFGATMGDGEPYKDYWRAKAQTAAIISLETAKRHIKAGSVNYCRFEDWPKEDRHRLLI